LQERETLAALWGKWFCADHYLAWLQSVVLQEAVFTRLEVAALQQQPGVASASAAADMDISLPACLSVVCLLSAAAAARCC
jgi:hypothetical protein